jgi:hypothetical protein
MYVRWQLQSSSRQPRQAKRRMDRLRAILVENVRVDGKPRQKHIAFLGSIKVANKFGYSDNDDASNNLRSFWFDVYRALARLGNNRLTQQDREQIIAALQAKVGGQPPTQEELEKANREYENAMVGLRV